MDGVAEAWRRSNPVAACDLRVGRYTVEFRRGGSVVRKKGTSGSVTGVDLQRQLSARQRYRGDAHLEMLAALADRDSSRDRGGMGW
jgi:hypothetical protein